MHMLWFNFIFGIMLFPFVLDSSYITIAQKKEKKSLTKDFNKIEPQHMCQAYSGYVHITSVKFSTILKICAFQLCRCSVYMEPPSPYKHLGTKLFKVMCEQMKKMERFHVSKVSGQIFSRSKNCSVPYEYNLNVSLS